MEFYIFSLILFGIFYKDCEAVKPIVIIDVIPATTIKIGGKVSLTCRVAGPTPQAVNWYHEDIQITPGYFLVSRNMRERYLLDSSVPGVYKINIINARHEDSGLWRCVVQVPNAVPPIHERRVTISVGVPDIVSLTPPLEVNIDQLVRLECNVTGEPEPVITWRRIEPVTTLPSGQLLQPGYVTQFQVRGTKDGGLYECQATNLLGTHKRRVPVNIKHPPAIDGLETAIVRGWLNIPVNITCRFSGYPVPRVTWFHNGVQISNGINGRRMIVTTDTASIVMLNPVTTDFGTYLCLVENSVGRQRQTIKFQPAVPPLPPVNIRVGSVSHNTAVLFFDAPLFNGGLPITMYRVVYQKVGQRTSLSKRFFVGQNTILTNLLPFTSYYVKIAAGNVVGYGNYSAEQIITTTGVHVPPGEPTGPHNPNFIPTTMMGGTSQLLPTKDADIKKPKSGSNASMAIAIVVGSLVALFIGGILILIVSSLPAFKWRRKRHSEKQRLCQRRSFVLSDASFLSVRTDLTFRPMSVQYDELGNISILSVQEFDNEFPRDRLKVGEVIGTGSFGQVLKADAIGIIKDGLTTVVALKTLKENATETDRQDFVKELGVMKQLKPHPNIVTLFGCCTGTDGPSYIVMEYLPNGNLLMHLRNSRQRVEQLDVHRASIRTTLSPTDLIRYAYEIANGMAYLASMMCIHRDLAARNILLSRDGVCKLSDFGLARDVVDSGVYQRKTQGRVPIRWMALESLIDNVYTIQSDVWSFGVLLWEVVTIGSYPYPGMSSKKLIRDLQRDYRMPKPDHCREEVYTIMTDCWKSDPRTRPNFDQLRNALESILIESRNYLVLDFDECLYDYAYGGSSENTSSLEFSNSH
ncbi:fibroblast growth factor receptor 2-like isoform X1 [Amphiura filiformis]|uniref:fibroblast growth factor receptor 2-like isoform X1 n=1 Tax=Amphiura filiformis TaxID=82378 RepID=UPI003B21430E